MMAVAASPSLRPNRLVAHSRRRDALLDPFAACWAIFRLWAPHPHILNKPHNTFNAIKHKK
ncbi:MAG: hypothetical protein P8104_12525 [Gammaproteobacteria bacterium]